MHARPNLIALIAGLISATAFAPLDWWPLLFAGLAALLALVHAAPTLGAALARGWWFGLGQFALGTHWLQHAFDYQDRMPPVLGYFAVALLAAYLALYPALAMGLAWRFDRAVKSRAGWVGPNLGFVLAAGAAWVISEWLRGSIFTGFPWNPLAAAWLPTGAAWVAAWLGTYAMSGVLLIVAGTLFLAATRYYTPALVAVPLCFLLAITGPWRFEGTPPNRSSVMVRLVQPGIGQEEATKPSYAERTLAAMISLSGKPGPKPRLILWPEGMIGQYIEDGYPRPWYFQGDPRLIRARIAAPLGPNDVALISGTALFFDARGQVTGAGNSVWSIGPTGMLGSRYDKAHLVPFGEYVPLRGILGPLGIARFVMGDIEFVPGPGPRTIEVPGVGKVGMLVCYEVIFSGHVVDRADRPRVIFNPSYDAWYGGWGPPQHLAQARLRAIEEGLPILRATPTGISAVIDADGALVASLGTGKAGAVEAPLPYPRGPTLFSRLGNALAFAAAGLMLLLAIANRRLGR